MRIILLVQITFIHVVDIVTSDNFTNHEIIHLFIRNTCNICQVNVYLYSAMRMKCDPGKIEIHGSKSHI